MSAPEVTMLPLEKLTIDAAVSARTELCQATIATYAEVLREGGDFPPVIAYRTSDKTFLAEGFLRAAAYRAAGRKAIPCQVIAGTYREAVLRAAGSNLRHGLPRSAADRRLSVLRVLQDEEGKGWTNVKISAHCGVGVNLIAAIRALVKSGATPEKVATGKIDHGRGGAGMPQTPAVVYAPAPAPKTSPARPTAPAARTPATPATPSPKPSAPAPPPPPANPWADAIDPPEPAFTPSAKDARPVEDDDGAEDFDDDFEGGGELDAARLRERMLRAGRKFVRYVSESGLDPHEALDEVMEDMEKKAVIAARRGRPERPRPDSPPTPAGE